MQRQLAGKQPEQIGFGQPASGLGEAVHPGGQNLRATARHGLHARALRGVQTRATIVDQDLDQDAGKTGDQGQSDQDSPR